jgi:hypothetical protein
VVPGLPALGLEAVIQPVSGITVAGDCRPLSSDGKCHDRVSFHRSSKRDCRHSFQPARPPRKPLWVLAPGDRDLGVVPPAVEIRLSATAAHHSATIVSMHFELTAFSGESETRRIRGHLLLRRDDRDDGEQQFRQAIDMARHRSQRMLELRATVSLARLWQQTGQRSEACRILGEIYGWFTEGFDTTDLRAAKALLDELSDPSHL